MKPILIFSFGVCLLFAEGFVLTCLWKWFVVSSFNVPELNLIPAAGITLMMNWLTISTGDKHPEDRDSHQALFNSVMATVTVLIIGWILHLFM